MARQISQTLNAVFECWDHSLLKNQCCGTVMWSDLRTIIDIRCYFGPRYRGSIFCKNNMECLWQRLDLTTGLQYNIGFSKRGGLSIRKLHSKSVIFAVPLNVRNPVLGQPANMLLDSLFFVDGSTGLMSLSLTRNNGYQRLLKRL